MMMSLFFWWGAGLVYKKMNNAVFSREALLIQGRSSNLKILFSIDFNYDFFFSLSL